MHQRRRRRRRGWLLQQVQSQLHQFKANKLACCSKAEKNWSWTESTLRNWTNSEVTWKCELNWKVSFFPFETKMKKSSFLLSLMHSRHTQFEWDRTISASKKLDWLTVRPTGLFSCGYSNQRWLNNKCNTREESKKLNSYKL